MATSGDDQLSLLATLRRQGMDDERVLAVMGKLDRRLFVSGTFADRAYENIPLPIGCGQTISQPSVVALMTQALRLSGRESVLEIGTGSGYQTAILGMLARRVYSVERHQPLVSSALRRFRQLGLDNVNTFVADGSLGLPGQAPFDRIMVTAAAEDPPGPLLAQLRDGGIMVIPVGQTDMIQHLIRVIRCGDRYDYEELQPVRFVPLVPELAKDV